MLGQLSFRTIQGLDQPLAEEDSFENSNATSLLVVCITLGFSHPALGFVLFSRSLKASQACSRKEVQDGVREGTKWHFSALASYFTPSYYSFLKSPSEGVSCVLECRLLFSSFLLKKNSEVFMNDLPPRTEFCLTEY